ncbi:MAG: ATP-binding protein [Candidatus Woesearchaeota archaeon]|nr:ATP-binding protein [Candidatus Woesearchaeota archaeon]
MKNINFIGRAAELATIQKLKKKSFFLVVKGRRRIGKTTLLKRAFPNAAYIFIWPNKSITWLLESVCTELDIPHFHHFSDIINYLGARKQTIIIDEFQNLLTIDKSIYGELQKIIDENTLQIAVAGSSHSLIKKVLYDVGAPLYGRRTAEISLQHLGFKELYKELKRPIAECIELWSVFEGVPYYYELVDKRTAQKNITSLLLERNALLQNEGRAVLSVEFGKEAKTYSTVLSSIAEGKTKLNEIATAFTSKTETIKYLSLLRNEFELVQRKTPLLSDPKKSKEGHYGLYDNFLMFWFKFVDKKRDYIEQGRYKEIIHYFHKEFPAFVGLQFEKLITQLLKEKIISLPFSATAIGSQWGSYKGEQGRNTYQIDICAVNEKNILFAECKWKENVDAEHVLQQLRRKSKHVDCGERDEHYMIFAKSFTKKKKGITIDLHDIEQMLRRLNIQ